MNVKLLKQVRDYIKRNPERYNQGSFCGSACCIAGTAALLSRMMTRKELIEGDGDYEIQDRADECGQKALSLSEEQASRLFDPYWFDVAGGKFEIHPSDTAKQQAAKGVKRINHFIKTKGAE